MQPFTYSIEWPALSLEDVDKAEGPTKRAKVREFKREDVATLLKDWKFTGYNQSAKEGLERGYFSESEGHSLRELGPFSWPFLRSPARATTIKAVRGTVAIKGILDT